MSLSAFLLMIYHHFYFFWLIIILSSKILRVFSGYNQKKTQRNLCRFLGLTSSETNYLQSTFFRKWLTVWKIWEIYCLIRWDNFKDSRNWSLVLTREYLLDTRSINYSVSTAFSLLIYRHSCTKAFTLSNSYSLFERVLFLSYKREKDL